jgi:hypothetical protein
MEMDHIIVRCNKVRKAMVLLKDVKMPGYIIWKLTDPMSRASRQSWPKTLSWYPTPRGQELVLRAFKEMLI